MKSRIYLTIGTILLLVTWLFAGFFRDEEFYESHIFFKYKPTFKVFFYSPIGESDVSMKELSKEQQKEQIAFEEFVLKQKAKKAFVLNSVAIILLQSSLSFFIFYFFKRREYYIYNNLHIVIHIFINSVVLWLLLKILSIDNTTYLLIIVGIIFIVNFSTLFLFHKKKIDTI